MTRVRLFGIVLLLTVTLYPALFPLTIEANGAQPVFKRFYPSDDATVAGCCINNNYGKLENLTIKAGFSTSEVCRIFIKFDYLNYIAPGSVIESAFLYLYMYAAPSSRRQVYCHRVTGANWTESTITWGNQPDTAELVSSEVVPTVPRWLVFDVKESVAKFASKDASDYAPNYGWRLSDKDESNSTEAFVYHFYSNNSNVALLPFVEVSYYPPHLNLEVLSGSMIAGNWIKMKVSRRTYGNEPITCGNLTVILSSSSTKKRFSLSEDGEPVTELIIPHGSDSREFWYYDENAATCRVYARTENYPNYGVGDLSITLAPRPRDNSPPVSTVVIGVPKHQSDNVLYVAGSTVFALSATDDVSGVSRTKYRVDDGSWNLYTEEFTLSDYPDGLHTIEYYSIDNAGNNEANKVLVVYLDKTPPAISGAHPVGSIAQESASVNLTVKIEDEGSGVKEVRLTVDGSSQGLMTLSGEAYTKPIDLGDGDHTWIIEAVDNVGNMASQSYSFTLTVSRESSLIWPYGVIIAISIVVVIIIALLVMRRRKASSYF
ncbi:MAG: DNRLRE domain-containing protein [Thermoproteota archaeon]